MRTILRALFFCIATWGGSTAQVLGQCSGTVYDPGGAGGNYPNNANWTVTYCPTNPGDAVTLTFTMFQLENGWDFLYIYNGPNTSSPIIGTYSGDASTGPGTVTSTHPSGCLTLVFTSDFSFNYEGWSATLSCSPLAPPPSVCGSTVYDPGGPSGNYPNYANWTQTYCPDNPGEMLSLIFTQFQVEQGWDYLYIYNGPDTSSPLLTTLTGSGGGAGCNTAYTSTHPSGCLTLRFTSDGSVNYAGWEATIICGELPPPTPSSPPEDCNGGITVCSNQSFTNNANWSGCVQDLNTSNGGCLLSGEQQGTWYFFSPNTAGTIGFTIAPTTFVDYDFALWGPLTAVSCPPSSPPLRCSYASGFSTYSQTGSYNTGLGNGASDVSESAAGNGWVAPINVLPGQVYMLYVDNFSSTAEAFGLIWNLSTPGMLDCTVLPMDLLHFTGELTAAGRVHLRWTTAHEHHTSHFVVERSTDGIAFDPVGEVQAAGHTVQTTDYETWDPTPRNGMNYYRLVQVDQDGTRAHANVVPILVEGLGARLTVVPNPAQERAQVVVRDLPGATRWLMVDAQGRLLAQGRLPTGADRFVVPLHDVMAGSYFVQMTDADGALLEATQFMVH